MIYKHKEKGDYTMNEEEQAQAQYAEIVYEYNELVEYTQSFFKDGGIPRECVVTYTDDIFIIDRQGVKFHKLSLVLLEVDLSDGRCVPVVVVKSNQMGPKACYVLCSDPSAFKTNDYGLGMDCIGANFIMSPGQICDLIKTHMEVLMGILY